MSSYVTNSLVAEGDNSTRGNAAMRYVISVEHDLAVLDYMSDYGNDLERKFAPRAGGISVRF